MSIKRTIWLIFRQIRNRLATAFWIWRRVGLKPESLRDALRRVKDLRDAGFDPAYYNLDRADNGYVSAVWHCALAGVGRPIKPLSRTGVAEAQAKLDHLIDAPLGDREAFRLLDKRHPTFSVILPTFNRRNLIEKAVNSVLSQNFDDWEIVIVDDGSTDRTASLLQSRFSGLVAAQKLRILEVDRIGASAARNIGLTSARGQYISYIDSDNEWLPNHLSTHLSLLADYAVSITGPVGSRLTRTGDTDRSFQLQAPTADMNGLTHHASLVALLGGFDERLWRLEDYDLILRYTRSFSAIHSDHETFVYQIQPDSLSVTRDLAPNRSQMLKNHALERLVFGLDERTVRITEGARSLLSEAVVQELLDRSGAGPVLQLALPGEQLPTFESDVYVTVGPGWHERADCIIAKGTVDAPLSIPRLLEAELVMLLACSPRPQE